MKFEPALQKGTLIRRYKRFLADITLENGQLTTIHCPNTGSMKNCAVAESPCWFSDSKNPKRKYPCSWEVATTSSGHLAGVNTSRSNALVIEAVNAGVIKELSGYDSLSTEVPYGEERSRIDILLEKENARCYVEVKNVTLGYDDGLGQFPDAVSVRGTKHLRELIAMTQQGYRAVLVFCVQHTGIERVEPADEIDPEYGRTLREAIAAGVEVIAYRAVISPNEITLTDKIPVHC